MIPKVIHYCWFGGSAIPRHLQKYIDGWKKICPDYEIKRWDESNYDFTKNKYMYEAYQAKKWGFVPDYARLDIIYNCGGIYLDTDVELLKPLDSLLNYPAFCGCENDGVVALGLGFGAEKGNPIIKALRDEYDSRDFLYPDGNPCLIAAPELQEDFFKSRGLKNINEIQKIKDMVVFPTGYFNPMDMLSKKILVSKETLSIHHYEGSWASKAQKFRWNLEGRITIRKRKGKSVWFLNMMVVFCKLMTCISCHGIRGTVSRFFRYSVFQTYNVGFIDRNINEILSDGIRKKDIVWMKHSYKDRYFADPFLLDSDEEYYYILCEEYLYSCHNGRIVLLKVNKKNRKLVYKKTVIEEQTHLSFPYCKFRDYNVFPEGYQSGKYYKYEIDKDTFEVRGKTLVYNRPFIDCVHYKESDGSLWLYGTLPPEVHGSLFSAKVTENDDTEDGLTRLLECDKSIARSAGDFFKVGGTLYRPVQDCSEIYGKQTTIMRMDKIGNAGFSMTPVITLNGSLNPPFNETLHTFNVYPETIVVDGSRDKFRLFGVFYIYFPGLFEKKGSK